MTVCVYYFRLTRHSWRAIYWSLTIIKMGFRFRLLIHNIPNIHDVCCAGQVEQRRCALCDTISNTPIRYYSGTDWRDWLTRLLGPKSSSRLLYLCFDYLCNIHRTEKQNCSLHEYTICNTSICMVTIMGCGSIPSKCRKIYLRHKAKTGPHRVIKYGAISPRVKRPMRKAESNAQVWNTWRFTSTLTPLLVLRYNGNCTQAYTDTWRM